MTFSNLRLAATLLLLAALAGCGESHSWRQKTIIEVETPNGVVSGGSVVEVTVNWDSQIGAAMTLIPSFQSRGEASFVEVAQGKYLFALTVNEPFERTYQTMINVDETKVKENPARVLTRRLETSREIRSIPPQLYPMLVTFDDINDPKSVRLVDPANLTATFGEGFKLKDIKLEITDKKVTKEEIYNILFWLRGLSGGYIHGGFTSRGSPLGLMALDFANGEDI